MREGAVEIAADADEALDSFTQLPRLLTIFRLCFLCMRLRQPGARCGQRGVDLDQLLFRVQRLGACLGQLAAGFGVEAGMGGVA